MKLARDLAGTLRPPRYARERPSEVTDRAAITLPSSSRCAPEESSTSVTSAGSAPNGSVVRNLPSTTARSAPARTRLASARAPPSRCKLVTTMVFPAPVSPVSTVRPLSNSAVAAGMAPRDSMRISVSTITFPASP
ncbi:Uncharacterised protein [Mycobacteroides abscessus subsp. abscessus]|nr:Uncharacterised protein [Mycobacteroides abscessus subsp. abscessus]